MTGSHKAVYFVSSSSAIFAGIRSTITGFSLPLEDSSSSDATPYCASPSVLCLFFPITCSNPTFAKLIVLVIFKFNSGASSDCCDDDDGFGSLYEGSFARHIMIFSILFCIICSLRFAFEICDGIFDHKFACISLSMMSSPFVVFGALDVALNLSTFLCCWYKGEYFDGNFSGLALDEICLAFGEICLALGEMFFFFWPGIFPIMDSRCDAVKPTAGDCFLGLLIFGQLSPCFLSRGDLGAGFPLTRGTGFGGGSFLNVGTGSGEEGGDISGEMLMGLGGGGVGMGTCCTIIWPVSSSNVFAT